MNGILGTVFTYNIDKAIKFAIPEWFMENKTVQNLDIAEARKFMNGLMILLKERKMTISEFSEKSNIGRTTLYRYKNGDTLPSREIISLTEKILGVNFSQEDK